MRNPRGEASERVGGALDVRVLEPSPPAVAESPWFADDPVAGGEVVPVERPGAASWAELCEQRSATDHQLLAWCEDRWLVRRQLAPLPPRFAETRAALHALAEHVIAPARFASTGKIGLRFTYRGFGTPFYDRDRQVRIEDGILVDGDDRADVNTIGGAAKSLGIEPGAPESVYRPSTDVRFDDPLAIDAGAARALGDWFGFCASLLEQLRADAADDDAAAPARVQIWPEHFDIAVDLGDDAAGARANFGGSPGDAEHPEPYLYVGPWSRREGAFWNEPFGASLGYAEILGGADPLAFLRRGRDELGKTS